MSLVLADGWLGVASFSTVVADLSGWVTSSICAPAACSFGWWLMAGADLF
jgi:hypothetical protein